MQDQPTLGHCLCRAITFTYDGPPNWALHCHCETCRRATSSPMTTWISVPRTGFRFTSGAPRYFNSSPGVRRGFCEQCGSPLTYEAERTPDEIHIYAASLADPTQAIPSRHVHVAEQLPWFDTADALPRYATTSRGSAPPIGSGPRRT